MQAQKKLYNTARPGTPEFEKALAQRNAALKDYLKSRAITNNKILKPLSDLRKGLDPRYKDLKSGLDAVTKGSKDVKGAPLAPNTASGGPVKPSAGAKVLGHLGKLGKGLGIAGTALGLYNNINKDGTAKGITETAIGTAAAYGTGAAIAAGCTAVGVAPRASAAWSARASLRRQLPRRQVRHPVRRVGLRPRRGRGQRRQRPRGQAGLRLHEGRRRQGGRRERRSWMEERR